MFSHSPADAKGNLGALAERLTRGGALALVAFLAGAAVMAYGLPPYDLLRKSFMFGHALWSTYLGDAGGRLGNRWTEAHSLHQGRPVVVHDPQRAHPGFNLVVNGARQEAVLTSMGGETLHRWHLPFASAWPEPPHMPAAARDRMSWRGVHLFPNGDLLAIYETSAHTPYGAGLIKIDQESRLLWQLARHVHHDVDVGPDGRIYALAQKVRSEAEGGPSGVAHLTTPYLEDLVLVISPDGAVLDEIPLMAALERSSFTGLFHRMQRGLSGDLTHANSIQLIDARLAAAHPAFEEGQLLLSIREIDSIVLLDPKRRSVRWALAGMWRRQHDATLLETGTIVLFDNYGHLGPGGASRVIELDPTTQEVVWSYTGDAAAPLFSRGFGAQQRLRNGNTLIVESRNGRALEVTRGGEIVWEYRSPHRTGKDGTHVMVLEDLERIELDYPTFLEPPPAAVAARTPSG